MDCVEDLEGWHAFRSLQTGLFYTSCDVRETVEHCIVRLV